MSTLATNKIGTLSGTADMSLPTTRPSQTLSAFLDSSGNLTFEETSIPVEFFVADGTAFVSSVLVDTAYLTSAGWTLDALTNSSGQIYGARVGMWNLSDAIKTNYLFQKTLLESMEVKYLFLGLPNLQTRILNDSLLNLFPRKILSVFYQLIRI